MGAVTGELSLLSAGSEASAHVLAETILDVHKLTRAAFNDIRSAHPELLVAMHKAIGRTRYLLLTTHYLLLTTYYLLLTAYC